jgi:cell division protein FtsQ
VKLFGKKNSAAHSAVSALNKNQSPSRRAHRSPSRRAVPALNKYQSPSRRRNNRLLLLRMRKFVLFAGALALISGAGFSAYHNNAFKKCGNWLAAEALSRSATAGFKVKDILVTGRKQISNEELLASLSVKQGMPIFGVDIAEAEKSLAGISWVDNVAISRHLPDTIVVALQERTPVALWQHQKKIFLIDKDGVVLAADNLDAWQNLPLVVGDGAEKNVTQLLGLLQAEPNIAKELTAAVRIEQRRWDLHLKNNITVKLPEQDTELALSRLAALEEKKNILGRNITDIDLRQPDRVMITPSVAMPPTGRAAMLHVRRGEAAFIKAQATPAQPDPALRRGGETLNDNNSTTTKTSL